jgi:hypothetical protein
MRQKWITFFHVFYIYDQAVHTVHMMLKSARRIKRIGTLFTLLT